VPFWSKDQKIAYSTINAKSETVDRSPTFREPWKRRRCLVPANWFYEWQRIDAKTKQPFAISLRDDTLFAFAGLWDKWKDKATDTTLETFTILTTGPNELMTTVHNRMPVILKPSDYARWLEPGDPSNRPVDLLRPYDAGQMRAWKVGKDVGNTRNNRPELVEPV
jgi:putative SOS response-associated peptidase YedK